MKKSSIRLLIVALLLLPVFITSAQQYKITVQNQAQEGPTLKKLSKPFMLTVKNRFNQPLKNMRIESVCINSDSKTKILNPIVFTDNNGQVKIYFKNGKSIKLYKIISKIYTKTGYKPVKTIKFRSMAYNISGIVFYVLGGLALFLFGMKLLSDGLQTSAGDKMQSILAFLSRNKYMGVLLGFIVTAVLQSSSITTVMLIGFVNAGIMTFVQTVGIIMGANIGTTVTGFIISLKASTIAFPILIFGFLLFFFGKTNKVKFIGQIFLGLGIIFLGLKTMSTNVKPLKDSVTISTFFIQFASSPFLAILAGMIVTFMIQSSSATLGLIITLGISGLIDIQGAFGLVLGSNIGTTITAQLAAIGGNSNARKVAMMHSIFNVIGVSIMVFFIQSGLINYFYKFTASMISVFSKNKIQLIQKGSELVIPRTYMAIFIAFSHAIFNIANTVILIPFSRLLSNIVEKIVPGKTEKKYQYLEPHLLNTPAIALSQTTSELSYMLTTARKLVNSATEGLFSKSKKWHKKFEKRENKVDSMQHDITEYLVKLTQKQMTEHEAIIIPKLIHAVNDIERIGDLSEDIMQTTIECKDKKIKFSKDAKEEILDMQEKIEKMITITLESLSNFDNIQAKEVLKQEKIINELEEKMRNTHIKRLKSGSCKVTSGIYFLDILSNFERIGDHLTNIAHVVIASNA